MEKCGCGNEENPKIIYADTLKGNNGWTPVFVDEIYTVGDTVKIARKLIEYIGGNGLKPTNFIGQYLSQNGYTTNRNLAINYKGPIGETGPPGSSNPNLQSLQQVTDVGNVTSNALQVSSVDNFNLSVNSTALVNYGPTLDAGGVGIISSGNYRRLIEWSSISNQTVIYNDTGNNYISIQEDTLTQSGITISGRVEAEEAILPRELVTLQQLTSTTGNYIPLTQKGAANGVATLDGSSKIPISQIPDIPTPTLGEVVTSGNLANQGFGVSGTTLGVLPSSGLYLYNLSSSVSEILHRNSNDNSGRLGFDSGNNRTYLLGGTSTINLRVQSPTVPGAIFSSSYLTPIPDIRVSGADGINPNDFVTLSQLNAATSSYTFENGLREDGGVVKLGLDSTTAGTTNEGLLTENTFLILGDPVTQLSSSFILAENYAGLARTAAMESYEGANVARFRSDIVPSSGVNTPRILIERIIGPLSQTITFSDELSISIQDGISQKGMEYVADYSVKGTLDDRWIPDWGAVKNYADDAQKKPSKTISSATYTFVSGDEKQWLIFTNSGGCTVTIPDSVFSDGDSLQGVQRGAGQIEFTAGSGVTLNKSSLSNAKTAVENSVFGIQFESASACTLFGELELI